MGERGRKDKRRIVGSQNLPRSWGLWVSLGWHISIIEEYSLRSIYVVNIMMDHLERLYCLQASINHTYQQSFVSIVRSPGPRFNIKTIFRGTGFPITMIRRSWGRRIFVMGMSLLFILRRSQNLMLTSIFRWVLSPTPGGMWVALHMSVFI